MVSIATVGPVKIAEINRTFVGHEGTTDVICFDYATDAAPSSNGENVILDVIICPDVAAEQAAGVDAATYSSEMVLYLVHALLHASGYDDQTPVDRTKMKRRERAIMSKLSKTFDFSEIFPPER